jgi:hypothetical protein
MLLLAFFPLVEALRCRDVVIPVSISSRNAVLNLTAPRTQLDVTNFALNVARQGTYSADVTQGYATVGGNYTIAATHCEPDDGPGDVLEILTHGIGFDRSYWHSPFSNFNYSYVARAVEAGHSTFAWDRLGGGDSSRGDPLSEVQINLELAALEELTLRLAGNHRIVHVGHSFGSIMTYNLVNARPEISSGIVLTGFSHASEYLPQFVLAGNLAPDSRPGYLALSRNSVQINYYAEGDFDPAVLETVPQPTTPGEILTLGTGLGLPNRFRGPVMVITGGTSSVSSEFPANRQTEIFLFAGATAQTWPRRPTFPTPRHSTRPSSREPATGSTCISHTWWCMKKCWISLRGTYDR